MCRYRRLCSSKPADGPKSKSAAPSAALVSFQPALNCIDVRLLDWHSADAGILCTGQPDSNELRRAKSQPPSDSRLQPFPRLAKTTSLMRQILRNGLKICSSKQKMTRMAETAESLLSDMEKARRGELAPADMAKRSQAVPRPWRPTLAPSWIPPALLLPLIRATEEAEISHKGAHRELLRFLKWWFDNARGPGRTPVADIYMLANVAIYSRTFHISRLRASCVPTSDPGTFAPKNAQIESAWLLGPFYPTRANCDKTRIDFLSRLNCNFFSLVARLCIGGYFSLVARLCIGGVTSNLLQF